MSDDGLYRMTPLEVAVGWVLGDSDPVPDQPGPTVSPRDALETVIREALERSPCGVSFSGGRDSSTILAVAMHVARRDGLPEPIPITHRFAHAEGAGEDEWQELVIEHLGVTEWVRPTFTDELDVLGPYATAMLRDHGLVWAPLAYVDTAAVECVPGGSLIGGEGGDEVVGHGWHRMGPVATFLRRPWPPARWRVQPVIGALAPRFARLEFARRRMIKDMPTWLRGEAVEAQLDLERTLVDVPLHFGDSVRSAAGLPSVRIAERTQSILALDHDVVSTSPLLDDRVIDALAKHGGRMGKGNRADVLRAMVGDLLPEAVISRTSKAEFTEAYTSERTRAFARAWDGSGVDSELVDPELLRDEWLSDAPSSGTDCLLQAAWLANQDLL